MMREQVLGVTEIKPRGDEIMDSLSFNEWLRFKALCLCPPLPSTPIPPPIHSSFPCISHLLSHFLLSFCTHFGH